MAEIGYGTSAGLAPEELAEFYQRLGHAIAARPEQIARMLGSSAVFVTARDGKRLIGVARGLCDGLRGYLTECKLDPDYQGEAAVTQLLSEAKVVETSGEAEIRSLTARRDAVSRRGNATVRHLGAEATHRHRFVGDDEATGARDAGGHGRLVPGPQAAQVDDLRTHALAFETRRRRDALVHRG